ncbi:hypothetical protein C2G38_2226946 [Gigaspora rosea]|uniref:Uncharacterized protein n=1 Tax=Gigaspora rosea TaxID=44941 RepID=A0A397U6P7_9GLOM|nr:hypothetical protein C2G38_2226946 [Gigaspora rosea]
MAISNGKAVWNANTSGSFLTKSVIFGLPSEKSQIHSFEHFFNPPNEEEQLYSLFKEHLMTKPEICKIKQYYATALNLDITCIKKYGKLQTKFGAIISSQFASRKGDISRNNYSIAAKLLVDKNAHYPRAPVELEE